MTRVNIALVGVGNCARSFLEGIVNSESPTGSIGVRAHDIAGHQVKDLNVVAAFDVAANKVGQDIAIAVKAPPNGTFAIVDVPPTGVSVHRGPTLDGISPACRPLIEESSEDAVNVTSVLREARTDVVVNYLPVGSDEATQFYAAAALEAGCAFVNCTTTPIALSEIWQVRFKSARVPLIGDDIKSQLGATILHRALISLFQQRGVQINSSYQHNTGGNSDFLNMSEGGRGGAKEKSKTRALQGVLHQGAMSTQISASVGYTPGLGDRKVAYIHVDGSVFGGAPVSVEVRLEVWDSPNSAGIVIDAVRYAKVAKDRGIGGTIDPVCAFLMKSPPIQLREESALSEIEALFGAPGSN
jgi:myo-inositol-1-phosphate synthase